MNGRIIGEKRGGVMRRFSHDPQGNTIAAYDSSGNLTDTFVYWPNGEVRVRTGTSTIPYQYSGAWGSYTDTSGRNYNVARYLRKDLARWMTVDPLWPAEPGYVYANAGPITLVDASGHVPSVDRRSCGKEFSSGELSDIDKVIGLLCDALHSDPQKVSRIEKCLRDYDLFNPGSIQCMKDWCSKGRNVTCEICNGTPRPEPILCYSEVCGGLVAFTVGSTQCAYTNCSGDLQPDSKIVICTDYNIISTICSNDHRNNYCGKGTGAGVGSPTTSVIHELLHMCGVCKGPADHARRYNDAANCIIEVVRK